MWVKVANILFRGASALTLDGKGRIAMPTRHREILAAVCANQLTITRHPVGALLIFPRPAWDDFGERVAALPMEATGWKRVFLGNAMDAEVDGSGRVLIAPELRRATGLEKDVRLVGLGSYFELWDAQRYEAHEADVMKSEMPESLKGFSF